jgi:hypothetical protein
MADPFINQPLTTGDSQDFILNARKDGSSWDLSSATVSLYLRRPDGIVLGPLTATVIQPTNGVAHYLSQTELSLPGQWRRHWLIQDTNGPTTRRSREIGFVVESTSE